MKIDDKTLVGSTALAAVLGLTPRRIQQLAKDEEISEIDRGKYNLSECVQKYVAYRVRERPMNKLDTDIRTADARYKKAKATKATLEAKELTGEMHRIETIEAVFSDFYSAVRGVMLAMPGRLAVDLAPEMSPVEVSELVRAEIARGMEELANHEFDQQKYDDIVRERMNWDKIDIDDDI